MWTSHRLLSASRNSLRTPIQPQRVTVERVSLVYATEPRGCETCGIPLGSENPPMTGAERRNDLVRAEVDFVRDWRACWRHWRSRSYSTSFSLRPRQLRLRRHQLS